MNLVTGVYLWKKKELNRKSSFEVERSDCSFGTDKDLCGLAVG